MIANDLQFGRAFANRIWGELMGFGIVEPFDEFDLSRYDPQNPPPAPWSIQPSNPDLLDAMARDFEGNHYSFRHLIRTMMKSSAYQLSSTFSGEWKPEYTEYYARKYVRMLSAAELHDQIIFATARSGETVTADAPSDDSDMALIPAGQFTMGRTKLTSDDKSNMRPHVLLDDRPAHKVTISAFQIDRHEVTNGQYGVFVQETHHRAPYHWANGHPVADFPVYNVS